MDIDRMMMDSQMMRLRTEQMQRQARDAERIAERAGVNDGAAGAGDPKLRDACEEFETLFLKQMLGSMRKNIQKSGLLDGGMSEEIFQDMLYDEYARMMAKSGDFGIARIMYDQLSGTR